MDRTLSVKISEGQMNGLLRLARAQSTTLSQTVRAILPRPADIEAMLQLREFRNRTESVIVKNR